MFHIHGKVRLASGEMTDLLNMTTNDLKTISQTTIYKGRDVRFNQWPQTSILPVYIPKSSHSGTQFSSCWSTLS